MIEEKFPGSDIFRRVDLHTIIPGQRNPYIVICQHWGKEPEIEPAFFDHVRTQFEAFYLSEALKRAVEIAQGWIGVPMNGGRR